MFCVVLKDPRMIPCKFPTKCLRCFQSEDLDHISVATKPPFDFDQPVWSLPCLLTKCHCDFYDGPTCLKWFLYKNEFHKFTLQNFGPGFYVTISPTKTEASVRGTRPHTYKMNSNGGYLLNINQSPIFTYQCGKQSKNITIFHVSS